MNRALAILLALLVTGPAVAHADPDDDAPKKTAPRKKAKARRMTIGEEFLSAYRVMRDTVRGTGRMRRKMERPGTDETE